MTRAPLLASAATAALLGLSLPAQAEQVFTEDVIVDGGLCAGYECASGDAASDGIRIKSPNPIIRFEDTNRPVGTGNWYIRSSGGELQFTDTSSSLDRVVFEGGNDLHSFMMDANGNLGLGEPSPDKSLHIKESEAPTIRLEQSTTAGFTLQRWDMSASDAGYQLSQNADSVLATTPFTIEPGAPSSGFVMAGDGDIGFGTSLPARDLHLVGGNSPALRLEQDTSGGFGNHTWDLMANDNGFLLLDVGVLFSTVPFRVQNGAANSALILASNGNIGMGSGAATPAAALHLHRNLGNAQMLIEEVNPTANPRTLLNLQNNGRPEIVMGNTATNGEWSFGAGTDFFLKTGTVGSTSGAKTKVFTVKQNGDAIVFGTLTTGGTNCGTGCDTVFSADYDLPSIADHTAQMYRLGHLPNVGPTIENQPVNLTDKLGRMLNELEHAHIYIAQQDERLALQEARIAALTATVAALQDRIAAD